MFGVVVLPGDRDPGRSVDPGPGDPSPARGGELHPEKGPVFAQKSKCFKFAKIGGYARGTAVH